MELKRTRRGPFVRPDTDDAKMVNEAFKDYPGFDPTDKVVMDCGGNVGGFMYRAVTGGCKRITCYEPSIETYPVLLENRSLLIAEGYEGTDILAVRSALWSSSGLATLYRTRKGTNNGSDSLLPSRARPKDSSYTVHTLDFSQQAEHLQPDVIKMDIEGAEYECLKGFVFPDSVKEFYIEFHPKGDIEMHDALVAEISAQFETVEMEPVMIFGRPSLWLGRFTR